jgi:hypothetical protein
VSGQSARRAIPSVAATYEPDTNYSKTPVLRLLRAARLENEDDDEYENEGIPLNQTIVRAGPEIVGSAKIVVLAQIIVRR